MNKQTTAGILPSPIRFTLTDISQQPAIYIGQANPLKFTLANSGNQVITFNALKGDPSATNYHFELRFRPGTLTNNGQDIKFSSPDWKMKVSGLNPDKTVSLYFTTTLPSLAPEKIITKDIILALSNVQALPGAEGARGTRVELRYANLQISDSHKLQGSLLQYVNIVNHTGAQIIPLRAEIIGSDTLLNNDTTPNEITIRLLSTQPMPVQVNDGIKGSKLTVHFDQGADTNLLGGKNLSKAVVAILGQKPVKGKDESAVEFKARQAEFKKVKKPSTTWLAHLDCKIAPGADQATQSSWLISSPTQKIEWQSTEFIDIKITDLTTNYQAGVANIYINYEDIPGYWDGQLQIPVQKSPIKLGSSTNNNFVGIGVPEPLAPLSISGSGALSTPNSDMHISNDTILFGGNNSKGKACSGSISTHFDKGYLSITGVGSVTDGSDRRLILNAEQEMQVRGEINVVKTKEKLGTGNITAIGDISTVNGNISGKTVSDQYGLVVPVGTIQMYIGSAAPPGWLLCNGAELTDPKYSALKKLLTKEKNPYRLSSAYHTLGGANQKDIYLPDFRGRFPVCSEMEANMAGNNERSDAKIGDGGGVVSVKLTEEQMPAHQHFGLGVYRASPGADKMSLGYGKRGNLKAGANGVTPASSWSFGNSFTGGGADSTTTVARDGDAHTNIPPYLSVNFIIKY